MKTYTNTKEIPAKLLYDQLKNHFAEFYASAKRTGRSLSEVKSLNYGLGRDIISIEDPDGTQLYRIDVNPEQITLVEPDEKHRRTTEVLDEFIESCLL